MVDIAEAGQFVNGEQTRNSQARIGHNQPPLDEVANSNVEIGILLLCREALVQAIGDRRLDRLHLRVMGFIARCMNRSAKAWPNRNTIALELGVAPVAVSNKLRDLRAWGYLVAERQRVPQANDRSLMVYTFGGLDRATIEREITAFCERIKAMDDTRKSPSTVTREVTEAGDSQRKSPRAVTPKVTEAGDSAAKVTEAGARKSPSTVDRNKIKENNIYTQTSDLAAQAQAIVDWAIGAWPDVFNLAKHPGMQVHADVRMWLEAGCNEQDDIRPAIEAAALYQRKRAATIGSWSYIQPRALKRRDDRLTGLTPAPQPEQKRRIPSHMFR
jgi:hypothetical protein